MPLTCELGWHRADSLARWNDGYYFSKCTRCGRDLVRTAYQRWHVPKGFRVVWQASPPEPRKTATLIPAEASAAAPSMSEELPIQEVLRHLGNRNLSNDGGVGCEDEEDQSPPPAAPEEVHLEKVSISEFRVDQLLVGEVIRPEPEISAEEESGDPELPFEEPLSEAEEDKATEATTPPVEEPVFQATQAPSRLAVDDFMSDSSDADFWDLAPRPREPQSESPIGSDSLEGEDALPGAAASDIPFFQSAAEDDDYEDTPRFQALDEGVDSIPAPDEEAQPETHDPDETPGRPGFFSVFSRRQQSSEIHPRPQRDGTGRRLSVSGQVAVASLGAAAVLMLVSLSQRAPSESVPASAASNLSASAAAATEPEAQPPDLAASPGRAVDAALFPARQKAFVTARILNCRASPVEQAGSVKKLSRGTEVETLAREGDWMSISHDGRQCWAAVRYISPDRPA